MAEPSKLMGSLKRLVCTLIAIVQTRLDLLSNEIEEERLFIGQMLLYGSVALLFFSLAILSLTALFLMLFWNSNHLLILGGFAALYFVAGAFAWNSARRMARKKSELFSVSLSELADDMDALDPRP